MGIHNDRYMSYSTILILLTIKSMVNSSLGPGL